MRDLSRIDWLAIALAAIGVLVSAFAGDFFSKLGGLLTLLAIAVAVYGFVSRARDMKRRDVGAPHE